MNFEPDYAQQQWLKKMKTLSDSTIGPSAMEVDEEKYIPRENFQALVGSGFSGLVISEKYGGVGERTTTGVLVGQVLAKACPSTYFAFLSHAWRVGPTIEKFGTKFLKENYLPQLSAGQLQGGWALAEKNLEDAKDGETVATKSGNMYIINGVKSFVTGASAAEFFIVITRLDTHDGPPTAFIIERLNPGVRRSSRIFTVGMRGAYVADLILDSCQVPESALLAQGEKCEELLAYARIQSGIGVATLGAGIIEACLDISIERATTRKSNGVKIGKFQEVHFKIAEMKVALDACMQIALRAAFAQERGEKNAGVLASSAKVHAAESAAKAADDTMQIFGGAGYIRKSVPERLWRDARFLKVAGEPIELTRRRIADIELAQYK